MGLDDAVFLARGQLALGNVDQFRLIRSIFERLGLKGATPAGVRSSLVLKGREGVRLTRLPKDALVRLEAITDNEL